MAEQDYLYPKHDFIFTKKAYKIYFEMLLCFILVYIAADIINRDIVLNLYFNRSFVSHISSKVPFKYALKERDQLIDSNILLKALPIFKTVVKQWEPNQTGISRCVFIVELLRGSSYMSTEQETCSYLNAQGHP